MIIGSVNKNCGSFIISLWTPALDSAQSIPIYFLYCQSIIGRGFTGAEVIIFRLASF